MKADMSTSAWKTTKISTSARRAVWLIPKSARVSSLI
jgi:hypothetical protein